MVSRVIVVHQKVACTVSAIPVQMELLDFIKVCRGYEEILIKTVLYLQYCFGTKIEHGGNEGERMRYRWISEEGDEAATVLRREGG